jgi:hypothetical protein
VEHTARIVTFDKEYLVEVQQPIAKRSAICAPLPIGSFLIPTG